MKVLAWVLGLLALSSTVGVGANWFRDRKQARFAASEVTKFEAESSEWQFNHDLEDRNDEMRAQNDAKRIENDNLGLEIAQMQNRGTRAAYATLARDRIVQAEDESMVALDRDRGAMGPDLRAQNAKERADASRASLVVYAAGVHRDLHLAYAIGVVWLAFGFACALAAKG